MSEEATLAQLRQSLGLLQVAFDAAAEAMVIVEPGGEVRWGCLLYTSPSPRDATLSRMPSSA